jgi:hypothetical protein
VEILVASHIRTARPVALKLAASIAVQTTARREVLIFVAPVIFLTIGSVENPHREPHAL